MRTITNATATKLYDLNGVNQVVVQKGNVGSSYIYALQLLHNQTDTVVYRARPGQSFKKLAGTNPTPNDVARLGCLYLKGQTSTNMTQAAGGHTQTWEYAGTAKENKNIDGGWFVGTKPKVTGGIKWDTQIARVPFSAKYYDKNTELPRISNLNAAGRDFGIGYSGTNLVRSEAAVTPGPDYKKLLITTIDNAGTGYFTLYNLAEMNAALNAAGTSDVNLAKDAIGESTFDAFKIPNFVDKIGSIQGYDIDDQLNIYVSSEYAPGKKDTTSKPRKIVKIPWKTTNDELWDSVNLKDNLSLDISGYNTEFEGIQVTSENNLYLTVAYHDVNGGATKKNRIYQVNW